MGKTFEGLSDLDLYPTMHLNCPSYFYNTMYSNFMFLIQLLFVLSCKNRHTQTDTQIHRDSGEYSVVVIYKKHEYFEPDGLKQKKTKK